LEIQNNFLYIAQMNIVRKEKMYILKVEQKYYSNVFNLTLGRMSFRSFFTQALLFLLPAHKSHHLLPPLSSHCPIPSLVGQLAGTPWRRSGLPAKWACPHLEISRWPTKSHPPLEEGSTRPYSSAAGAAGAMASPAGTNEVAAPPVLPLGQAFP
jgi:hypothetical protein